MKMKIASLLFLAYALSGCETIYFERGVTEDISVTDSQWHHGGGIFGLVEFSKPFSPEPTCGKAGWTAVKVDHTFPTAFVSAIVPYGIYTPWEVSVRCGK